MGMTASHLARIVRSGSLFGVAAPLSLLLLASAPAGAEDAALPSGAEIARSINARDDGRAVSRTLVMHLIDRRGGKRTRETRFLRKYYGDEKRSVIFYQSPTNVKDTAFLTYDYPEPGRDDDQWLYLPALRKVRRISSSDRGTYFLGTDLTYEDVKKESKVGIEDYTWKTLGEETLDGHRCYLVEAVPVNEKTARDLGYGRVLLRVDPAIWMIRKSEYWDVRGNLLKTSRILDIRPVQGIATAHRIEVENHKTGHRTEFVFRDVDYETELDDDLFTQRALRRGLPTR